jgi:hypothetical protein
MVLGLPVFRLSACLALSYAVAAGLGWQWEKKLTIEPRHGMFLRGQAAGGLDLGQGASQTLKTVPAGYDVRYDFLNFDRSPLFIHLVLSKEAVAFEYKNYGYTQKDLDAIQAWRQRETDAAYQKIVAEGGSQIQVNQSAAYVTQQYQMKVKAYLHERGFKFENKNTVEVDVPEIVKRSQRSLLPLTQVFQKMGQDRGYDDETIVGAVVAMVQTAISYRDPGELEGDRHIGGFLPPLAVLSRGYGDCDTKSGTIGSILTNWSNVRMIGVALPDHYLCGILRIPQKGDLMIEYRGLQYVLIEAAGPAWLPPGTIGSGTADMLAAHEDIELEPFFEID